MDATAVKQLAERDWLFEGSPIYDWIGTAGRSPYFVGWWNVAPEGSEQWAASLPLRPAPRNSAALGEGNRFLVVADEEFHLLLVYPVPPGTGQYVRGMDERESRDHVISLRTLHGTVREFLMAVSSAEWPSAASALCVRIREGMDATASPDAYLASLGVPRLPATELSGDSSPAIQVGTMVETEAEVIVEGDDLRRAGVGSGVRVRVLLTLTKTRRTMGPLGWEIVQIRKIEERPWP